MSKYIFGYGSLINLRSLSNTINREVFINDVIPVKLLEFKRTWNLKETVFSEKLNHNVTAIFLNIKPAKNEFVNGIIFKVSDSEYLSLLERERNYSQLDITNNIVLYQNLDLQNLEVIVFISTDNRYIETKPTSNFYVMEKYVQMVEEGCSKIGAYFLTDYKKSTSEIPFKILEGKYSFIKTSEGDLNK